jgi:hypothetical protein
MENFDRWIDENEAAKICGRCVRSLQNDRWKGTGLNYTKFGRSVRYRIGDILDFMESRRVRLSGEK